MTPSIVLKMVQTQEVKFIDLRFMDFPGLWQHSTFPISELTLESFDHGFGFGYVRQFIREIDIVVRMLFG